MDYFLGLDIGTSSVKASLVSTDGKIIYKKTEKFIYSYENNMKVIDADYFCKKCFSVMKELSLSLTESDKILSLCISGAGGNLLLIKDGKPLSSVISWQNEFEESIFNQVLPGLSDDEIYNSVGWPKLNSFPLAALSYYKVTQPDLLEDCDKICMHIEYLGYKLTGNWAITPSMGTTFYLIDQKSKKYNDKFLKLFDISTDKLPQIYENCTVYGYIDEKNSFLTGLPAGTPVVCGTFDHPSAARGAGVFDENEIMVSCGTSWVVFAPYSSRDIPISKNMLTDPYMSPKGNWCGMKSLASISETIEILKKKYLGEMSYKDFDALAKKSCKGCNGLVINDEFSDVSGYDKRDIARAIIECIANKLNDMLAELRCDATVIKLVGGITNSEVWCDVISDITKKEVRIINGEYAGAIGSAIMAGVGIGYYKDEKEAFEAMNFI